MRAPSHAGWSRPRGARRVVGDLEERPARRLEDARHLAHVAEHGLRVGDVLEDDVRHAAVGDAVGDAVQRRPVAVDPVHAVDAGVELPGAGEHLARDVDRPHLGGARGERAGQPAETAADVDGDVAGRDVDPHEPEQPLEVGLALSPEALDIRVAVCEPAVDEEERVLAGALVPEALHLAALGHGRTLAYPPPRWPASA
jgi:hypothetical protein